MRCRIGHATSHAVAQAVVVALLVSGVVFRGCGLRLLIAATLRRVVGRWLVEVVQAAAALRVALIVTIAVGHLRAAVEAGRAVAVVVLALAALRIGLSVLPAAFVGHLVHLAALVAHVLAILAAVGVPVGGGSHVHHVRIDAAREQHGEGGQQQVFHGRASYGGAHLGARKPLPAS